MYLCRTLGPWPPTLRSREQVLAGPCALCLKLWRKHRGVQVINTWMASQATLNAALIGAAAQVVVGALTVGFALWGIKAQLANDRTQRSKDRRQQAAKDTILAAVVGMTEATNALAMLGDRTVEPADAYRAFTAAASKINVASAVASVDSIEAGKSFMAVFAPIFMAAKAKRDFLGRAEGPTQEWTELAFVIMEFQREKIAPAFQNAIVVIRRELDVGDEDVETVRQALQPALALGQRNLVAAWDRFGVSAYVAAPDITGRSNDRADVAQTESSE